ncbi:hypothetical protein [Geothrix fuzhouensis]|nr:hypothetical protein [Geothrix fuzhouensis]
MGLKPPPILSLGPFRQRTGRSVIQLMQAPQTGFVRRMIDLTVDDF